MASIPSFLETHDYEEGIHDLINRELKDRLKSIKENALKIKKARIPKGENKIIIPNPSSIEVETYDIVDLKIKKYDTKDLVAGTEDFKNLGLTTYDYEKNQAEINYIVAPSLKNYTGSLRVLLYVRPITRDLGVFSKDDTFFRIKLRKNPEEAKNLYRISRFRFNSRIGLNFLGGRLQEQASGLSIDIDKDNDPNILLPNLNEDQMAAVKYAIEHQTSVIDGRIGTGKTQVAVAIARWLVLKEGQRVLVCAPYQSAVDQLASIFESYIDMKTIQCSKTDDCLNRIIRGKVKHPKISSLDRSVVEDLNKLWDDMKLPCDSDCTNPKWLKYDVEVDRRKFERIHIKTANVICSTLIQTASRQLHDEKFHTIIIDDAHLTIEPNCLIALRAKGLKQIVLIGDSKYSQAYKCSESNQRTQPGYFFRERWIRRRKPKSLETPVKYEPKTNGIEISRNPFVLPELISRAIKSFVIDPTIPFIDEEIIDEPHIQAGCPVWDSIAKCCRDARLAHSDSQ